MQKDSDADLLKKAREGMTDEEAQFSVEMQLGEQNLLWSDKYRPRKPRFFNRVHTVSVSVYYYDKSHNTAIVYQYINNSNNNSQS